MSELVGEEQGSLFGQPARCCAHALSWHVGETGRCSYPSCTGACQPLPSLTRPAAKLRRDAAPTSQEAAAFVLPRSGTQRWRVLMALAAAPATDEELVERLGIGANSERPRRLELVEQGWVENSGQVRETCSGCDSIVWAVTARAVRELA